MRFPVIRPFLLALLAVSTACGPKQKDEAKPATATAGSGALLTVGSVTVNQADLDHQIKEVHGGKTDEATRKVALAELAERARLVQAALDEKLLDDPVVRAEFARVLSTRLKDKNLFPQIKEIAGKEIPEARLRDLYAEKLSAFRSNEKRQAAVLWLDPGKDPERAKQYAGKLTSAREWLFQNEELKKNPAQGFSTLGVDYSEHQASRYKNGVVGWMESGGGADAWSKAVTEIVFSLAEPGAVSDVITRPEGVFLVRYMAMQPAVTRSFESVADDLARTEKQRLRQTAESEFNTAIEGKYPVRWSHP